MWTTNTRLKWIKGKFSPEPADCSLWFDMCSTFSFIFSRLLFFSVDLISKFPTFYIGKCVNIVLPTKSVNLIGFSQTMIILNKKWFTHRTAFNSIDIICCLFPIQGTSRITLLCFSWYLNIPLFSLGLSCW